MRKNLLAAISILAFLSFSCSSLTSLKSSPSAKRLDDGSGAYATKRYRNLFKENGHSQKEIDQKIERAFQQLFAKDSTSPTIYFAHGNNANGALAFIYDVNNNDIRSEGISYGMMIAVQLGKKAEFDALWNYAMTYMYISDPKHPSEGYFSWSLKRDGTPNSETPAPDGEEYFVTSLYFASARWGDKAGVYNYKAWADEILATMRHHPVKTGLTKFGSRSIGPMVTEQHKMILFVPDAGGRLFSDPSYHLPAFYELWARWGPENDRAFWAAAADTSRNYFQKVSHPLTGLAPDYADFEGKPVGAGPQSTSQYFSYDSWRTAMNLSVDWSWWRKDPREQELSEKIQSFFASQGISAYGHQYTLDGKVLIPLHSSGLVSTNATASLAARHNLAKDFVEELWKLPVPSSVGERYYGGLLYLMSLLHCSGKFQIYEPKL